MYTRDKVGNADLRGRERFAFIAIHDGSACSIGVVACLYARAKRVTIENRQVWQLWMMSGCFDVSQMSTTITNS